MSEKAINDANAANATRTLPDQHLTINELIQYPTITLSASSLTPLEKIYLGNFLITTQAQTVVELGVFKARTTAYICAFMAANQLDGAVYGFDLPETIERLRAEDNTVQGLEASGCLQLQPGSLPYSLKDWLDSHDKPIDLALVDALHEYNSVRAELELIWPRLAPQGVILCHDYDYRPEHDGTRYAVDDFAARYPDAQMLSLIARPEVQSYDSLEPYKYVSTLAVIRRRPYDLSSAKLREYHEGWAQQHGQASGGITERIKALIRKTPLYGLLKRG